MRASVRALTLSVDEDIAALSAYLWQRRIAHRIFEERGQQILEVKRAEHATAVRELYRAWRAGELVLTAVPRATQPSRRWALLEYPALLALLAVALLCFPATWPLDRGELGWLLPLLTVVPVLPGSSGTKYEVLMHALLAGELWRLFTPILLHFSFAHLAFNAALFVEFGRRIEHIRGPTALITIVLTVAAVSNLCQYALSDSVLFGGLSGVVYGLFGFVLVRARIEPEQIAWQLNAAFVLAVVGFLVLMSTGITEAFGLNIANTAHWSGLLCGLGLGFMVGRRTHE
ncbi:MAG: rhomboid family intramembrane serine protease [Gammaproteobacteria bacterium]|nr:rhomboid family intramembrane serine protease [Gammaproteobacteria bacterium]